MKIKSALAVSLGLLLASCGGERTNDPDVSSNSLELIQQSYVDDQVLPAAALFLQEASTFDSTATAFCNDLSIANLTLVQTEWKDLSVSWAAMEHLNFGPVNDDLFDAKIDFINSFRLRGTDYTETVRAFISDQMAATDAIDFDRLNFNDVGLLALEIVAYETTDDSHSQTLADIVAEYQGNSRKCVLLQGYADQIKQHATYISQGWNVEFKETGQSYRERYLSGTLEDGSESLTTLLTKTQEHLDYIKKRHVVTTMAKLSDHSWQNAQANISAVELMLEGTSVDSFFSYMIAAGESASVEAVRTNIQSAKDAITVKDAASYEAAIGLLDGNFKREIPDALSIDLGINFSDGD